MKHTLIIMVFFSILQESWGEVSNDALSYTSTFTFPNALPNRDIQITKSCNIKTGLCTFASNSYLIRNYDDLVKLEQAESQAIRNKYGAISGSAIETYQRSSPGDTMDVIVTLKEPDGIRYLDKTKNAYEDLQQQAHTISVMRPTVEVDAFLPRYGLNMKEKLGRKCFRTKVCRNDIEKIMHDKDIASIDEYVPSKPAYVATEHLTSLAPSAYWHGTSVVPSTAGSGVNAATFELGIDPRVYDCFNYSGNLSTSRLDMAYGSFGIADWHHSQWTFHCLITAAPGANLWHRASTTYNTTADSSYIVNNNIQTVSLSYTRTSSGETYGEFRSIDDHAYYAPYPVFCNPAGNYGYGRESEWLCYNAINVGNVNHNNLTHFELADTTPGATYNDAGCTQTVNPPAKYGSIRDREMPNLVAPGFAMHDNCVDNGSKNIWCGTSISAPIVNGLAADVISADTRMLAWPEKVRAVLLVTAQNVDRGYWSYTVDGRDGAGVVHGANAVSFAQAHTSVSPNNTAVVNGIGTGSIYASDFNSPNNPIVYNILIPNPKPTGKHLRVVLTWDSNPVLNAVTNELSDLDLLVTNGSAGNASQSNNSNIEMVDMPISTYSAGSTVQAKITKWANRIPAGSRANFFYYAIAWTWVNDHAE